MQHGNERLPFPRTEPRLEPLDGLRRERNFRHEHNRAFALFERVRDGLQIDLRLAGAGDAVQKKSRGWRMEGGGWFFSRSVLRVCNQWGEGRGEVSAILHLQ